MTNELRDTVEDISMLQMTLDNGVGGETAARLEADAQISGHLR